MPRLAGAYKAAYNKLNAEQKKAVDTLEGPVLVVAGPGTGKTQLLTTRIGHILEESDVSAANILCLTFSEAAARTMKERLAALIGPDAYEVTISTYHGFGSELIRSYPGLFNLRDDVKPADDLMIDSIIRNVLEALDYSNPLKSDYFVRDIKELISGYKRALITPETIEQVCQSNLAFIRAASDIVNEFIHPGETIKAIQLPNYRAIYEASSELPGSSPRGITPLKTLWLEDLGNALDETEDGGKMTPLSKWKAAWLENDGSGRFKIKSERAALRQQAAAEIFRHYNSELERLGLYDYDDMIMNAIRGLEANPDIKFTLQERYQYILLDEFQDTNEAQLKLVELLADNPVNEGRPNILAVGDDDQAIYSFQGAHYSHMKRFFTSYRDVELVNLKTNYRSTPGIVAFSSAIRTQIKESLDLAPKALESANTNQSEELKRVELPLDAEHLAWVAEYVKQLIDNGENAEDIAILAPKHRLLGDIIPFLHANNIPISYEQKDNILEDPLIEELTTAARLCLALTNDGDEYKADHYWPIVLSHSYWQLPTSVIWNISWEARKGRAHWTNILLGHKETKQIALFFIRLAQIAEFTSFELMLNYLIGSVPLEINEPGLKEIKSPFYDRYFNGLGKQSETIAANEWRLLGHLSILRSRAKASSEDGLNLAGLIKFIDAHNNAELKIIDSSPFQESTKAVKLMTAFASKGQEFKTVLLIELIDEVWGSSGRSQSSKIALPVNLKHVKLDTNNDDEKLRLLFVAASRARSRLVMVSYQSNLAGKEASHLRYLDEREEGEDFISPYLPKNSNKIIHPRIPELKAEQIKPVWFDIHLDTIQPERRALLSENLKLFKLSATKLNNFGDITRGGPTQFYIDNILQFPQAPSISSQFGSTIHTTLDWQFKETLKRGRAPEIKDVLDEYENKLRQRRLASLDFEQLLKRGRDCLQAYFESTSLTNNDDDLSEEKLEVNFGEAKLVGEIDRLMVDRKNKTLHLIDFKTGQSYDRWGSDIKPFHHARQLYFYKLLIEQSPKFKGFTVDGATLQFVEPDKDDLRIKSIKLDFKDQESEVLKRLIEAIWGRIMALDFPDTSAYPQTLKGIRQFEAELLA